MYCLSLLMPGAWHIGAELCWWFFKILEHWQVIIGLIRSDLIHWGLDVLITEHKSANSSDKNLVVQYGYLLEKPKTVTILIIKPYKLLTGYKTGIDCSIKLVGRLVETRYSIHYSRRSSDERNDEITNYYQNHTGTTLRENAWLI